MLFQWGEAFAGFLHGFPPLAGLPYLADVARLEWLRARLITPRRHRGDPRRTDAGGGARPPCGARLHPSARLLQARLAAVSIWRANQPGAEPGELDAGTPEDALILRDPADRVQVLLLRPVT